MDPDSSKASTVYRPAGRGRRASGTSLPFQLMIAIAQEYPERSGFARRGHLNVQGRSHLGSGHLHATRRRSNPNDIALYSPRCAPAQRRMKRGVGESWLRVFAFVRGYGFFIRIRAKLGRPMMVLRIRAE